MAQMSTIPVFACRVCGKPVYATHLSTQGSDPNNEKLKKFMRGLASIALCPYHQKVRNYYASQGREDEFLKEQLSPASVIYSVRDNTGLNYYNDKPAKQEKEAHLG